MHIIEFEVKFIFFYYSTRNFLGHLENIKKNQINKSKS